MGEMKYRERERGEIYKERERRERRYETLGEEDEVFWVYLQRSLTATDIHVAAIYGTVSFHLCRKLLDGQSEEPKFSENCFKFEPLFSFSENCANSGFLSGFFGINNQQRYMSLLMHYFYFY